MVAESPCGVEGPSIHPDSVVDTCSVLGQPPSNERYDMSDSRDYSKTNIYVEHHHRYQSPEDQLVLESHKHSSIAVTSDSGKVSTSNDCEDVFFDYKDNYNLNCDISSELPSFQSTSDLSDTVSAYSDSYSNNDYSDSFSSGDSSTAYLLPKPNTIDEESMVVSVQNQESNSGCPAELTPTNNDKFVDRRDCDENKETVASHTSSTQPLINQYESIWGFVKEVEVSAPVIGVIDYPGFISSQRDLPNTNNLSFACQKALKYLQDERVVSSLLLPGSYKDISKQPAKDGKFPDDIDHNIVPSGRHTHNLILLSVCNTMVYIACGSLRNLQSSINHEGGIGITSLAVSCFGFVIGSIFSPFFVQKFDPYRCLLASLVPQALYIAANFYPILWLMVPTCFIQGISSAIWWNAMSTYVTFLAKGYSEKKNKNYEKVLNRFFGIFCLIYQMYMVFGNLIASLVLTYANPAYSDLSNVTSDGNISSLSQILANLSDSMNSTYKDVYVISNTTSLSAFNFSDDISLCGAKYCHHYTINNMGSVVSEFAKYLLFSIYIACMVVTLLIVVFLLEPLNRRLFSSSLMTCCMVKSQMVSIGQFIMNRKFLLLCPLLLFSSMEQGFATAEITKAFVTCPVGVHMVGYTMICMGVSASCSAYLSGWLSRFFGRTAILGLVP